MNFDDRQAQYMLATMSVVYAMLLERLVSYKPVIYPLGLAFKMTEVKRSIVSRGAR